MLTVSAATPVPVSVVAVPPVNTGAAGGVVSIVIDKAPDAALTLPPHPSPWR